MVTNFAGYVMSTQIKRVGYSRLDALIEEHGEEWLVGVFVLRVSDGEAPRDISVSMGLPWHVLRRWLEDSPDRMRQWELGKRCFADGLVWEGLKKARDADVDTLGVDKFQAEYFQKTAGKMSRDEWGERVQVDTTHKVEFDFRGMLESREERLMGLAVVEPDAVPSVVAEGVVVGGCEI